MTRAQFLAGILIGLMAGCGLAVLRWDSPSHAAMAAAVEEARQRTLDLQAQGLQGGCWPEFNLEMPSGYEIICQTAP